MSDNALLHISLLMTPPSIEWNKQLINIGRRDSCQILFYAADQGKTEYEREPFIITVLGEDAKPKKFRDALSFLNIKFRNIGFGDFLHGQKILKFKPEMIKVDAHEFAKRGSQLLAYPTQDITPELALEMEQVIGLHKSEFLQSYVFDSEELQFWQARRQNELLYLYYDLLDRVIQFYIYQRSFQRAEHYAKYWLNSRDADFRPLHYLCWLAIAQQHRSQVERYLSLLQEEENNNPNYSGLRVNQWRELIQNEEAPPLPGKPSIALKFNQRDFKRYFIYRTEKYIELETLLTSPYPPRVIGVTGLPGAGKTHFIKQTIHLFHETHEHVGVAWFELTPNTDLEVLLNSILSQLRLHHLQTLPYATRQQRFKQHMKGQRSLIVIDEGASAKLNDPEYLQLLVNLFDQAYLLLISRELPGDIHYPFELIGFDIEAVRQFLGRLVPGLEETERSTLNVVTKMTQGLPLVLNWLVGFVKKQLISIQSFVNALPNLQVTTWSMSNVYEHYEYILNWLWQHLDSDEINILCTVSIFDPATGINIDDITTITDKAFRMKQALLKEKIHRLIDLNLLHIERQMDNTERYTLHPITYMYVKAHTNLLQDAIQLVAIQQAYVQHFIDFSSATYHDFQELDTHKNNIVHMFEVALLQSTLQIPRPKIIDRLNELYGYFEKRGLYKTAEHLLKIASTSSDDINLAHIKLLYHLGRALLKQGLTDKAESTFKQVWELAQQSGLTEVYGIILRDLGGLYLQRGDVDNAKKHLENAKEYAEQSQWILYGQIMANLGSIAVDLLGQYSEAQTIFDGIKHDLQTKDDNIKLSYEGQDLLQFVETALGVIATVKKDYSRASNHLQQSLEIARALNNPERVARVYLNLGVLGYHQSEFDRALNYFIEGGIVSQYIQNLELLAWFTWNKGAVYAVKGNYQLANRTLYEALEQANELNLNTVIPNILVWLGIVHFAQYQFGQAHRYFTKIFEAPSLNPWFAALALYGLGLVTRFDHDPVMKDNFEVASNQINTVLGDINRTDLPAKTRDSLESAQDYFQIALQSFAGLRNFRIVEILREWMNG